MKKLKSRNILHNILFAICAVNALQCSSSTAGDLSDRCGYGEFLDYESVEYVLQYSPNEFKEYHGDVVYVGNRMKLNPEPHPRPDVPLCKSLFSGQDEPQVCQYIVVASSEKIVTGTRFSLDGSKVDEVGRFFSVLVAARVQGTDKKYALFTLTRFNDRWRLEKSAVRFYINPPTLQDVDTFLLEHDTPDHQLVPRSSIEGASDAELNDAHVKFYSIRICQAACEDLFGGVPRSLAGYL